VPLRLEPVPGFVLRRPRRLLGVPVLLFHRLEPAELDRYLAHLAAGGYRTLSADEAAAVARRERPAPGRAVVLTFDDGLHNHWAVVAPLLRRRGMRGITFVVPRLLGSGPCRPRLDDIDARLPARGRPVDDPGAGRFLNWDEVTRLDAEGALEVQSHTWDHARVFVSDRIIDFQRPLPDGRPRYPWLWSAVGAEPDEPLWGAPVYPTAPRLVGRRYLDDPYLRDACRRFVDLRGGRGFFADVTWRRELRHFAASERRRSAAGSLEPLAVTARERLLTLTRARDELAERLGHAVDHLALPWSRAGADTRQLLAAAGYRSAYTRVDVDDHLRPGADPLDLARLEGYWLESLPGPGRLTLLARLRRRLRACSAVPRLSPPPP
jgi:peptidoglycan/xylan/chitin deacetylase (PgdA/CDA1 family)